MRGKSDAWKEEMRKEYSDIKVIPIDLKKISKEFDAQLKEQITKGEFKKTKGKDEDGNPIFMTGDDLEGVVFECRGTYDLAFVKGTQIPIDKEAIVYVEKDGRFTLDIYMNKEIEGGTRIGMFPIASSTININELVKEYGMEETDLPTFMDSRFVYNDRIVSNMRGAKNYLMDEGVLK